MVGSNKTPNRMISAVKSERAWLQQCDGCLPVLLVHHCKGVDIYIRGKSEPLTEQLRIHLQYQAPAETDTLETPRRSKEDWHRERTIWAYSTQPEIIQLLDGGWEPPDDPRVLAKVQRAKAARDARHQRQIDREAQRQESNNRKHQRAAKPQRKGTRKPLVNNSKTKVKTTIPTTDEGWLDAQIESMINSIQAKATKQLKSTVAV